MDSIWIEPNQLGERSTSSLRQCQHFKHFHICINRMQTSRGGERWGSSTFARQMKFRPTQSSIGLGHCERRNDVLNSTLRRKYEYEILDKNDILNFIILNYINYNQFLYYICFSYLKFRIHIFIDLYICYTQGRHFNFFLGGQHFFYFSMPPDF